ncbi:MAG: Ppx/GppA phosphatase family protein [Pseudomonadota bacterium]
MNSPIEGAGAPDSEPGPKNGRKRHRGKRRNRGNGKANVPENAEAAVSSVKPAAPEETGSSTERSGSENASQQGGGSKNASWHHGRKGQHGGPNPVYAALDLGTNNCRLLIAVPQNRGHFRVIDGFSRIVRLGEGLSHSGRLSDAAMDRAVEALQICAKKLDYRKIRKQRLIATEACRQAANGEVFLNRVRKETGLELEIVSREMEAYLAAEGCGALMDRRAQGAVLFDIGGGSSELILVNRDGNHRRKISDQVVAWTSLPMGVVTLAERFGGRDVTRQLFDDMVELVLEEVEQFPERDALSEVFAGGNAHLLGTSGTVTTLAGIHLKLPKYDRRQVDGLWLDDADIDVIIDELLAMSYEERAANPCIGKERADLVLAGCAILNAIRKTWPAPRLRVADRGLREGLLTGMMHSDGSWRKPKKGRWSRKYRMKRAAKSDRSAKS